MPNYVPPLHGDARYKTLTQINLECMEDTAGPNVVMRSNDERDLVA